jgi:isoleucyl-tRNA synthetase
MDYSKTVNLPKTDFPMKADLSKREPAMLELWDKEQVYQQALERRKGKEKFILHDGPPYANGHLHLGHALNKILKDIIVRYKTMAGYYAPYVPGWDCHGLPIELQLMKELKVTDKHKVDRAKFRDQAKSFAEKFVEIQKKEFKRLGVLGDWDHPYFTMAEDYKKTIVDCFLELEKKGYVYRGKKPVYWCSTDETALAEAEVEYENDKGPSVFVAFPSVKDPNLFYVIWTTTPWTLPANLAIAFNREEHYARYRNKLDGKTYIVAEKLAENFQQSTTMDLEHLELLKNSALAGAKARHPWANREVPLLPAGFVAMDTGTGLVHIAPGHGREDYVLGSANKLEVLSPVDDRGRLDEPGMPWHGVHVFKANDMIMDLLQSKGALLYRGEVEHSYPHCWRCHKPVIFRATEQWFLSMEKQDLRVRLLKALEGVKFYPEFGRNRITGMVETRPDWCLSRQRLWGTEIPDGSVGAHRSAPSKEPDIFDVWFESGVSWAAVLKNSKEWPELNYPADMYLEGSDQHRGWFQVSLIPSVALEGKAPFKSILTHGFVMDGEGRPMSKSLGNVIAPDQIIKQYGADVLRLWVAASDYGGDVRLSQDILKSQAEAYRKVRNTLRYLLNNLTDFDTAQDAVPANKLLGMDRWALHRLQEEVRDALAAYDEYKFYRVAARLVSFCILDLSGFYLDVIKDRLYCDPPNSLSRRAAQTVLHEMASKLMRLLAPILSYTTDECWRFFRNADSVALEDMPLVADKQMNSKIMEDWKIVLSLRESVLGAIEKARAAGKVKAAREVKARIRVRVPEIADSFKIHGQELPAILGVSQIHWGNDPHVEFAEVDIEKADGSKCARCWIYKMDVGVEKAWPDLCKRCAEAVEEWQKTVAEVK